jgi:hypothetical protein
VQGVGARGFVIAIGFHSYGRHARTRGLVRNERPDPLPEHLSKGVEQVHDSGWPALRVNARPGRVKPARDAVRWCNVEMREESQIHGKHYQAAVKGWLNGWRLFLKSPHALRDAYRLMCRAWHLSELQPSEVDPLPTQLERMAPLARTSAGNRTCISGAPFAYAFA